MRKLTNEKNKWGNRKAGNQDVIPTLMITNYLNELKTK